MQSEVQASLTKQLISKIGAFNHTHKGEHYFNFMELTAILKKESLPQWLSGSLSGEDLGVGSLRNIHNLSLELEQHVRIFSVQCLSNCVRFDVKLMKFVILLSYFANFKIFMSN